jgi:hypothetical protein
VGQYEGAQTGKIAVEKELNQLVLIIGEKKFTIYPETEHRFFSKERDLVFEFVTDAKERPLKILVYERGKMVEEVTFRK